MNWIRHPKLRVILALLFTLSALYLVSNRLLVLVPLAIVWVALFAPFNAADGFVFALAALFFLLQNYVCLKAGLFEFKFKDILLMPYYEPFLWGFYFTSMRRFVSDHRKDAVALDARSVAGLVVTSVMFSLFSSNPRALLIATGCSTAFLFLLFHTRIDWYYAAAALTLGIVIELFGVSTGLWSYPASDFLGIPYWFATMWISAGLLGRRFLMPAAEWLAAARA